LTSLCSALAPPPSRGLASHSSGATATARQSVVQISADTQIFHHACGKRHSSECRENTSKINVRFISFFNSSDPAMLVPTAEHHRSQTWQHKHSSDPATFVPTAEHHRSQTWQYKHSVGDPATVIPTAEHQRSQTWQHKHSGMSKQHLDGCPQSQRVSTSLQCGLNNGSTRLWEGHSKHTHQHCRARNLHA